MTTAGLFVAVILMLLLFAPVFGLLLYIKRRRGPVWRMSARRDFLIVVGCFSAVVLIAVLLGHPSLGLQDGLKKEAWALLLWCPFFAWQVLRRQESPWLDEIGLIFAVLAGSYVGR